MEKEDQFLIVVFHVSKDLLPEVVARGFGYNSYDTQVETVDGAETLEEFLAISFVIDATGVDLASMQINEHAIAESLGIPSIEKWDWHFEVCSEDALPAGTYWIGDINSVACDSLLNEIPGFDEVVIDTVSGDLIRSIESHPGLFYAVLPCKEGVNSYVDKETGDEYLTESKCIGIIPRSLISDSIQAHASADTGGDYLTAPVEIAVGYDLSQGRIVLGSDRLGGTIELHPCE